MFDARDFDRPQFLKSGAIYAKMDQVWLLWGEPYLSDTRPEALAIQNPPFFQKSQTPWALYPYAMQISRAEAQSLFAAAPTPVEWEEVDEAGFKEQFDQVQEALKQGKVEKVVPYLFEKGLLKSRPHFLENFIGSALQMEKGFLYGCWSGEQGEIGLTPEVLISQMNDHQFATMALAGTCSIEEWEKNPDQFKNDPKENLEHQKVVEDIVNQLKPMGAVDVFETQIVATNDLVHFLTPLELKTNQFLRLEKLVERLHPTAALGGFPRSRSMRLLRDFNEKLPRGRFGAPFAVSFTPRSADVIVSIRNVVWDGDKIKIGSGCGVVDQSQYQNEWDELRLKRASIKKIFGVS